jgi:hypothetical protein
VTYFALPPSNSAAKKRERPTELKQVAGPRPSLPSTDKNDDNWD